MRVVASADRIGRAIFVVLAVWACASPHARGKIVGIEYYDRGVINPEYAGGPLWTGQVDTAADTLTILTWTELPLHGSEFWIPQNLPQVWPARDASGAFYDVPETFDGTIDETFAFISNQTLREMAWLQPAFDFNSTPPVLTSLTPVTFTLETLELRPGWGGMAYGAVGAPRQNDVFLVANPNHQSDPDNSAFQPPFDEKVMPALPVSAYGFTWSTEATISTIQPTPVSVPEAGAFLFGAAACGAAWATRRRR